MTLAASSGRARAAMAGSIRIGALLPLTGAGGPFGPSMAALHKQIVDQVNAAGGIEGQRVEYSFEDDQTNPDAAVLGVRKLIDVNKVCAVMGLWSSGVAAPTLPICAENKVVMVAIAASDSLALQKHDGYFFRSNVDVGQQGEAIGNWALKQGGKSLFGLLAQNPFSEPMRLGLVNTIQPKGMKAETIVYDGRRTDFRAEVGQALQAKPDILFLGGYPQDSIIIMKEVFRAGYGGKIVGTGTCVTQQFLDGVGKQVSEGIYTVRPSSAVGSPAYKNLQKLTGKTDLDTNVCQSYDQINLVLLAIAQAKQATGTAVRDNMRKIGDPNGEKVDNVLDGLKLIAAGKSINYEGAASPCKFTPTGNLVSAIFETLRVADGKLTPG